MFSLKKMAPEFDIIRRYFHDIGPDVNNVVVDIGDDGAVLSPHPDSELVMTLDVLVNGVHFPEGTAAERIAHKALAVNLSDLAAMGATPSWFTLGLSLPEADETWLAEFAQSLAVVARRYCIRLVGGDLTRGPLTVAINACGSVNRGLAVKRSGARVGDQIILTGCIGGAALGLDNYRGLVQLDENEQADVRRRLDTPEPRLPFGSKIAGIANAAIDVSDGLAQDLNHVLNASNAGATIELEKLPLHPAYLRRLDTFGYEKAVSFGDDYELLLAVPQTALAGLRELADQCEVQISVIGTIEAQHGLRMIDAAGQPWRARHDGHDHFREVQ